MRDSTVDVMRLSIIVRNNLEKDGDGSEYHAASSSGAPSGDVKLNHTDAELDFEEQSPDGTGEGHLLFEPLADPAISDPAVTCRSLNSPQKA